MKSNINININIEGIRNHFYKNDIQLINKSPLPTNDNKLTVIKKYDFFTKNEIKINNILHLIDNKKQKYISIVSAKKININEISANDYIIIKYSENNNEYIEGITFFLHNKCEKEYICGIIDSYLYLLQSLDILQKEGVIYFNFSSEKLKFKTICNPHCILYDFNGSLLRDKMKNDNIETINYFFHFISKTQNFTFKSFEVHVLYYLYKMDEEYLSKYKISIIIERFVQNMKSVIKGQDGKIMKSKCELFMEQFINKNKNDIILNLINCCDTWDNYSVSILYLNLVENIIQGYRSQMRFMTKFQDILFKNISPCPEKRLSVEETIIEFKKLFQYWI